MSQLISRSDLTAWINALLAEYTVIAPTKVDSLALYQPVKRADDIFMDFGITALSPKEWLFPPTETLFTITTQDGTMKLEAPPLDGKNLIFAIRPCDARGFRLLDKVFLAPPADTHYAQRRQNTTLIGLACSKALPQCFCTSVGGAPNDASDVDVLLTEVEEGYLVNIVTEKGQAAVAQAKLIEKDVTPPSPPNLKPVSTEGIVEATLRAYNDDYWERLADRCTHCNVCAFVCPACYCFDVRDHINQGKTERLRCWDSCQAPGFTRVAGGYTPRPTKGARLRQRFGHKLLYYPQQYGDLLCVGCGRCIASCPVNIDIREVMEDLQKLGVKSVSARA
ncbi:MAG: 4Fe-4S dicluster domain-containing protein [Chloroflexi bacterium]|nr:4Fe-4S dicluster domain-containing protein [Chloroflexota bacterium]